MAYRDVGIKGRPAGGKVREDDVPKSEWLNIKGHDAGAPSPGIISFIYDVIYAVPEPNDPPKPDDFPTGTKIELYPGKRTKADVHLEGRAADIYLDYKKPDGRVWGDWLFDWSVKNCKLY